MSNDNYTISSVDARGYRRGYDDAKADYEKKIDALTKRHIEELDEVRAAIEPRLAAARNLGASLATEAVKNTVLSNIGASSLSTQQRRDLAAVVTSIAAPEIPDQVAELTIKVEKQAIEISQLKQQIETQVQFKKMAMAQRAETLSNAAKERDQHLADGRVAGLREAAELIRDLKLQKSPAKKPTKLSADIADKIIALGSDT